MQIKWNDVLQKSNKRASISATFFSFAIIKPRIILSRSFVLTSVYNRGLIRSSLSVEPMLSLRGHLFVSWPPALNSENREDFFAK